MKTLFKIRITVHESGLSQRANNTTLKTRSSELFNRKLTHFKDNCVTPSCTDSKMVSQHARYQDPGTEASVIDHIIIIIIIIIII